jgi:hypothetical protein
MTRSASSRDAAAGGEPHIRRPFGSCRNQTETMPITPDQEDHRKAEHDQADRADQAIGLRPMRSDSMPIRGMANSATTITTICTTCEVVAVS